MFLLSKILMFFANSGFRYKTGQKPLWEEVLCLQDYWDLLKSYTPVPVHDVFARTHTQGQMLYWEYTAVYSPY